MSRIRRVSADSNDDYNNEEPVKCTISQGDKSTSRGQKPFLYHCSMEEAPSLVHTPSLAMRHVFLYKMSVAQADVAEHRARRELDGASHSLARKMRP